MKLTTEIIKDDKTLMFMGEVGMVKRISRKLVLKYSPKEEQPYLSPKGLKALWNLSCLCYYCKRVTTLPKDSSIPNVRDTATIDHKTPTSKGGKNDAENRVLSCLACNNDKAGLTEGEYHAVLAYRKSLTDN